jgi:hypothetical protein
VSRDLARIMLCSSEGVRGVVGASRPTTLTPYNIIYLLTTLLKPGLGAKRIAIRLTSILEPLRGNRESQIAREGVRQSNGDVQEEEDYHY